MNVDASSAERIGLDWLRAAVAPVGAFGRRYDESVAPYGPGDEARARDEIAVVMALVEQLDRDGVARVRSALRAVPEPTPIVARLRAGDPPSDVDFYELSRFVDALEAVRRAWDAAGGGVEFRPPVLEGLSALLAPGRREGGFYLADPFGVGLHAARSALADAEAAVDARREAVAARVRDAIGVDPVGEEFVVLREVYNALLPEGVRIVRETPTYRVFAIDVLSPELDAAAARLGEEEERARLRLGERIAGEAEAILAATRALGVLDRTLARIAFAQRWGGCVPQFVADRIAFEEATFAPLSDALAVRGRRYTPLTIDLRGVAVLTGPNMGGKSAALATAGFLCACAALGVPPPARSAALPLLDAIVSIGGEGPAERTRLLSAYAAEVVRARETLAGASSRTLVLVDEFARTTRPREGRALLVAFVEALRAHHAFALIATHFDGIGEAAGVPHLRIAGLRGQRLDGVEAGDLEGALDAINAAMDYRVVPAGEAAGESDALALAALLGLDGDLIARARAIHGSER